MTQTTKIGLAMTGGAVTPRLINVALGTAAQEIHSLGGQTLCLNGGFGAILAHLDGGYRDPVFEITAEMAERWLTQDECEMYSERILPRRSPEAWVRIVNTLKTKYGIRALILIGGNGTGCTYRMIADATGDQLVLIQIPKSMDDDFVRVGACLGAHSTLSHAINEVRHYAKETGPSIVRVLGREAGHFCLNIADKCPVDLSLIAEEFGAQRITDDELVDLIVLAQLCKWSKTGRFGVTLVAEGVLACVTLEGQKRLGAQMSVHHPERVNYSISPFEQGLKERLAARYLSLGINPVGIGLEVSARSVGYAARCWDLTEEDLALAKLYGQKAGRLAFRHDPRLGALVVDRDNNRLLSDLYTPDGEVEQLFVDLRNCVYGRVRSSQFRVYPDTLHETATAFTARAGDTDTARRFCEIFAAPARLFASLGA